ncbi:Matrixin [Poriferisphaera corsica]|uniref:Matrixin n=2 Tax=Poriferisphaera corsica TaxID=2528020 RepID=A0A517YZI0_9BACT|nr:Matrixin [Poriferisphaera corsica]
MGADHIAFDGLAPWTKTMTDGNVSTIGTPITLTWSIVPDNTTTDVDQGNLSYSSQLISTLDDVYKVSYVDKLKPISERSWFSLFSNAFDRWGQVSGLSFEYLNYDDGARHGGWESGGQFKTNDGKLGVRADMRIAGARIDGPYNTLAYNYYPEYGGDMLIDLDDTDWEDDAYFENVIIHEMGHGFGLPHLLSESSNMLMEPYLDTSIHGPQFDDILMMQRLYGDRYEKGLGNETMANATDLGTLTGDTTYKYGSDARKSEIEFGDIDFLSIDDDSDVDVFKFTLDEMTKITFKLSAVGMTYDRSAQPKFDGDVVAEYEFDAKKLSDLALEIIDEEGDRVALLDRYGLGGIERLYNKRLAEGDYFLRVMGANDNAQFYELSLQTVFIPEPSTLVAMGGLMLLARRRRGA